MYVNKSATRFVKRPRPLLKSTNGVALDHNGGKIYRTPLLDSSNFLNFVLIFFFFTSGQCVPFFLFVFKSVMDAAFLGQPPLLAIYDSVFVNEP